MYMREKKRDQYNTYPYETCGNLTSVFGEVIVNFFGMIMAFWLCICNVYIRDTYLQMKPYLGFDSK